MAVPGREQTLGTVVLVVIVSHCSMLVTFSTLVTVLTVFAYPPLSPALLLSC